TGPGGTVPFTQPNAVTATVPAPVANFAAAPTSGVMPLNVAFTDQTTGAVTSRTWDFGDGTLSTVANPSHIFALPGTYTGSLTANGPGGTDVRTRTNLITVSEPFALQQPTPGVAGTANTYVVSGVAPGMQLFLIGSLSLGSSPIRASTCSIASGLSAPM